MFPAYVTTITVITITTLTLLYRTRQSCRILVKMLQQKRCSLVSASGLILVKMDFQKSRSLLRCLCRTEWPTRDSQSAKPFGNPNAVQVLDPWNKRAGFFPMVLAGSCLSRSRVTWAKRIGRSNTQQPATMGMLGMSRMARSCSDHLHPPLWEA